MGDTSTRRAKGIMQVKKDKINWKSPILKGDLIFKEEICLRVYHIELQIYWLIMEL